MANEFKKRTAAPSTSDQYWIHTGSGGLNECIEINHSGSCLPNCVGYAWGRFYEITGKRPALSKANAENWYGYTADGYQRSQTPAVGAVICWRKGQAGVAADGAGHVAIVEEVKSNGDVVTSNSGYGGPRFYMQTVTKASGYSIGSAYTFQGFILPPASFTSGTGNAVSKAVNVKGIDVSKWQGDIDWKKVKAAGIEFAMLRLGYGSSDGNSCGLDSSFEKNVAGAVAAGVDIGCYFYSYALSAEAAKKEGAYVAGVLSKYKGVFTYPIAFDIEDNSQVNLGKTVLTNMVIAFCEAIEKAGFYCSFYSNLNWLRNYLNDAQLSKYDHWLAQWASAPTYTGAFGMWQYSSTGKVNGISTNVDMNIAYKDYPTLIREGKLNGFSGSTQKPAVSAAVSKPSAPAAAAQSTANPSIQKGCLVKITGSKYYSGVAIPAWVKAKNWYVSEVSGSRAVINKSEDGKHAINSPINVADIALVSAADTSSTPNTAAWTPAVGDKVRYNGTVHYTNANAAKGAACKGGIAEITQIYRLGKSKHPYHLVHKEKGCTVYGWVDAGSFTKA